MGSLGDHGNLHENKNILEENKNDKKNAKTFLKKGQGSAAWSSQLRELKKQKSITLSSDTMNKPNKFKLTSYQLQSTMKNENFREKDLFSPDNSKELLEFEKIEKMSESCEKLNLQNNKQNEKAKPLVNYQRKLTDTSNAKNDHNVDLDQSPRYLPNAVNFFNQDLADDYDEPFNQEGVDVNEKNQLSEHSCSMDENSLKMVRAKYVPGIKPVNQQNRTSDCASKNVYFNEPDLPDIYLPEALSNGQVMIMTDKLKIWITKLESEIQSFNQKIKDADESKNKYDRLYNKLKGETSREEAFFLKEKKEFEEYRDSELKRLKRERKVLDDYQVTLKSISSKKDRSEIDRLLTEIETMKTDYEGKVSRLTTQLNQSRSRVSDLEAEKTNLRVRISRMEQEILDLQTKLRQSNKKFANPLSSQQTDLLPNIQSVNQMLYDQLTKLGSLTSSLTSKAKQSSLQRNSLDTCSLINGHHGDDELNETREEAPQQEEQDRVVDQNGNHEIFRIENNQASAVSPKNLDKFQQRYPKGTIIDEKVNPDGSIETKYSNGLTTVKFTNGSVKEIYPGGKTSVVYFFNGDMKTTYPDGRIIYTYAVDQTMHISFPDKPDEIHYADGRFEVLTNRSNNNNDNIGQLKLNAEATNQNGPLISNSASCLARHSEVIKPSINRQKTYASNPSTKTSQWSNDRDQFVQVDKDDFFAEYRTKMNLPSGCVGRQLENGNIEIHYPNGQIEVHSSNFKRRIYPDGNTKTIFYDGRQETIYASGRIRVKDALGNLVFDSRSALAKNPSSLQHQSIESCLPPTTLARPMGHAFSHTQLHSQNHYHPPQSSSMCNVGIVN